MRQVVTSNAAEGLFGRLVFGLCDNSRSGLCQLFMAAAHCAGKCMQQVWFWELASSKLHSSFVLAVIGAEKCVQWTYVVCSSFFRVKPKDIASDKTCKQQTWLLESLLQSEANGKRVWSFLLEAGFGKLASKVVLPQGAEVVMKHLESLLQNFCSRRGFGPSSFVEVAYFA